MGIVLNTETCCGCRACELACSFHHCRVFSPELSSIRIWRDNQAGEIQWDVDSTCDLCTQETHPLCVENCVYGALKVMD